MNQQKYQLETYKKFVLNEVTANNSNISRYIENCLAKEDEAINHTFHKVMVINWTYSMEELFDTINNYFLTSSPFSLIPVNPIIQGHTTSFYTSNLKLILMMIKLRFKFLYHNQTINLYVIFNEKVSIDLFNERVTVEDIVTGVICRRFTYKFELDLSDLSNDDEFKEKAICFYKISLLSHFKILMLRMSKDTKSLNLSNNYLSHPPSEILNFFIKGKLTSLDLSNNNIASLADMHRISGKIEKLWMEENPLCETMDATEYIKRITMNFPRLCELDGIKIYDCGLSFPKYYLQTPDMRTKIVIESFLTLYFSYYDSPPSRKIHEFYDEHAILTINNFTDSQAPELSRDNQRFWTSDKVYYGRDAVVSAHDNLPPTRHDIDNFNFDVLQHDIRSLVLIVDGAYKEKSEDNKELYFQFRRTFIFSICNNNTTTIYQIINEMLSIVPATPDAIKGSLKISSRNLNTLALIEPEPEDIDTFIKIFIHITNLKKKEAKARLKKHLWDLKAALQEFISELRKDSKKRDRPSTEEDEISDISSLINDEELD